MLQISYLPVFFISEPTKQTFVFYWKLPAIYNTIADIFLGQVCKMCQTSLNTFFHTSQYWYQKYAKKDVNFESVLATFTANNYSTAKFSDFEFFVSDWICVNKKTYWHILQTLKANAHETAQIMEKFLQVCIGIQFALIKK
jgi:hypothetical protein